MVVTEDLQPKGTVLGLLELLDAPPEPRKRIDAILAQLGEDERAALQDALSKPSEWPHEALAGVLTNSGHPVSEASVRRYRKGLK